MLTCIYKNKGCLFYYIAVLYTMFSITRNDQLQIFFRFNLTASSAEMN